MALVFGLMTAALLAAWRNAYRLAVLCFASSLVTGTALFLWEVYSPDDGFRMPWIQVERDAGARLAQGSPPAPGDRA